MKAQENNSSFPLKNALQGLVKTLQPQHQPETQKPVDGVAYFVRPVIDVTQTLKKYRDFAAAYNEKVPEINKATERYNRKVAIHKKETPPSKEIIDRLKQFTADYYSLYNGHKYNALVEAFNNTYGNYLMKRKIQTIKPQAVEFFASFLHEYSCDLHFRNAARDKYKVFVKGELPKMEINPNNIINQMRNGFKNINTSTRTIRNQRQRMEEAGILVNYTFKSHRRAIEIDVNNEILTVFEAENSQKRTTENQRVRSEKGKKFPHANVTTRTQLNKKENKGKVNNLSQDKEFAIAHNPITFFYKTTDSQGVKNSPPPAEKNHRSPENLTEKEARAAAHSENLREQIEPVYDLAEKLANGEFDYYTPFTYKRLEYEVANGNLSPEEFRELIIQDFMKTAAKLWIDNNAAPGSWYNAIEIWNNEKFLNFTGNPFNKHHTLDLYREYRYRLSYAVKWFKKRNWKGVHYPNIYFDPTRKMPEDVCFEYTKKAAKQLIEKRKKTALEKKMRTAAAAKREQQYKLDRKNNRALDQAIRKYLKKGYNLDQLINYIKQNLPGNYMEKLPVRLEQLTLKMVS